jgi:DME family drug/metabolite transporter
MTSGTLRARLLLIAAAALFSTGGAAIKLATLNAWQVAAFRSAIAAVAILLFLPAARRAWQWHYVPVAAAYGATLVLFVSATKLTTAANAIFLQDAAPLFVLLLGPLLLHERIRTSDLVLIVAVACAMLLLFTAEEGVHATAPDPARGNLLAAVAAITWALTLVGLRWIGRDASPSGSGGMATVALGNLLASATALPFAFPVKRFEITDVAVILWLGIFQIGLAYMCLTRGIRSVPAFEATTLLLLEPALNPIWSWLIHGERPAPQSIVAGAIILLATLANAWWQNRGAVASVS